MKKESTCGGLSLFKAAKREEGGRGGSIPVPTTTSRSRGLRQEGAKQPALSFFPVVFSESHKMIYKGESKPKSKECLPDPRILSVFVSLRKVGCQLAFGL